METLTGQLETEQKLAPQQAHDRAMGDDSGKVHSATAGGQLNADNYRIRAEDRVGQGSLKQKCRDNFAAIELAHRLVA
jgi:hypothetical protein